MNLSRIFSRAKPAVSEPVPLGARQAYQKVLNDRHVGKMCVGVMIASGGITFHLRFSDGTYLDFGQYGNTPIRVDGVSTTCFGRPVELPIHAPSFPTLLFSRAFEERTDRILAFMARTEEQYAGKTLSLIEIGETGNVFLEFESGEVMMITSNDLDHPLCMRVNGINVKEGEI
ncbi:MAG: hypothetical protein NTX72_04015 [Candidatus Uhrbacteria bacterium]|nr:hypothetical protein [Candidatus Uhrbacteria bacterium]